MRKPKVYCSIPVSYDWEVAKSCIKAYHDTLDIDYWTRNTTYDQKAVENADCIVFFLPDNAWAYKSYDLPSGLRKELSQALNLKKKIYIAYKNSGSRFPQIYEAYFNFSSQIIEGMSGTYGKICDYVSLKTFSDASGIMGEPLNEYGMTKQDVEEEEYVEAFVRKFKEATKTKYDRRLLLC